MKGTKAKKKTTSVWMILPLYFFTLVFVAGPLIYMVALSFAQPGSGTSVEWNLTLENYRKILDPVYLQTFRESFQLALTSNINFELSLVTEGHVNNIGDHLSGGISFRVFYGKNV